jgi:hydroxyethylthiazole kinase-like uncharacterized protein yjeF
VTDADAVAVAQPVLTPRQMADADAATIAAGTPGAVLMERAGAACTTALLRRTGGVTGRRFVVVAGGGNNGGDGWVVARRLRRMGAAVRTVFAGDPARLDAVRGDAAGALATWRAAGGHPECWNGALPDADVVVDAVFGTGFHGAADGTPAAVIDAVCAARAAGATVVSLDIPSGVDGATGAVDGPAVTADLTVAIQACKCAHVLDPGAGHAGDVEVVDIGIDTTVVGPPAAELADPHAAVAAVPPRAHDAHKWSAGAVCVIGGSVGMSGAPQLTAHAAARAGAGLVVAVVPDAVRTEVAGAFAELMTVGCDTIDAATVAHLPRRDRFAAFAVGPGLGPAGDGADPAALVRSLLDAVDVPVVLDADALNALGADGVATLGGHRAPVICTPHDGEFARLDAGSADDTVRSRIDVTRDAARRWGVTLVRKGPATVVASPHGGVTVCRSGGPELATAGSGDTLTGVIAAYAARGATPHAAAVAAVCVHGRAGAAAAADGRWVLASDLHDHLGAVERELRA